MGVSKWKWIVTVTPNLGILAAKLWCRILLQESASYWKFKVPWSKNMHWKIDFQLATVRARSKNMTAILKLEYDFFQVSTDHTLAI